MSGPIPAPGHVPGGAPAGQFLRAAARAAGFTGN